MKIIDINGCTVEINNLNDAIQITRRYKQYEHQNKGFSELDKKLNRYWMDMYEKLLEIKSKKKRKIKNLKLCKPIFLDNSLI